MSYDIRHCPFLNRDDPRCAACFQVGHMEHAFRHCFENYKGCPTYLEMLVERRVRRMTQGVVHADRPESFIHVTISGKAHAA